MNRTAPNSPAARAHARINPTNTPREARGSAIRANAPNGELPSVLALCSSDGGIESNAEIALFVIKGNATNTCASIIPRIVPSNRIPKLLYRISPINCCLENTLNNAIPAADCGIIIGISISDKRKVLPKKLCLLTAYAKGTQKIARTAVDTDAVTRVR